MSKFFSKRNNPLRALKRMRRNTIKNSPINKLRQAMGLPSQFGYRENPLEDIKVHTGSGGSRRMSTPSNGRVLSGKKK